MRFARAVRCLIFALSALLSIFALAVPARADASSPCGAAVTAWVARAGAECGDAVEPVSCRAGGAALRLQPAGVPPVDIDVAEPPGDAFFHAGRLRVSPMLDVPDYAQVPAAQREAIARLVRWLSAHESEVTFVEHATPLARFGAAWLGPWLLLSALGVAGAAAWLDRGRIARREWGSVAVVFAVALGLRLALGVWGPLRVNGFGPLWITGAALDRAVLSAYGPGYAEVFGTVARFAPRAPDTAIFIANAVLSASLAAFVFALARAFGGSSRAALLSATVLAVDAASIRVAASESYFVVIEALTAAAALATAAALRRFAAGARVSPTLWGACAALLCAQAARVHPCAWVPISLVPLAALAADAPGVRARGRILALLLAAAIVAAAVLLTSGKVLVLVVHDTLAWRPRSFARELAVAVLLTAPLALFVRPRRIVLPAAAWLLALAATRGVYGQSPDWQSSYDRLFAAIPLIAVCTCIPDRWLRARAGLAVSGVGLLALLAFAVRDLRRRTTDQLEYSWLRPHLDALAPGCRVTWVGRAGSRVLALAEYRVAATPGGPRPMRQVYSAADVPSGCVRYYRSSLCSSVEGRPACDAVERSLKLAPLASTSFPALPSNLGLPYDRASVEVAWFEVEGR